MRDAHKEERPTSQGHGEISGRVPSVATPPSRDWRCFFGAPRAERRDAAEHRRKVLAVARGLFAACGVDAVSMHQIALAAGIGQSTLYRRYAHKGELCMDLLAESLARFHVDIERIVAASELPSALDCLDAMLERLVAFNEENGPLLGALRDCRPGERGLSRFHNPFHQWAREALEAVLTHAVERGEVSTLDVSCTAEALLSALAIDHYMYQRDELGHTPQRIIAALRRLFIDGQRSAAARR